MQPGNETQSPFRQEVKQDRTQEVLTEPTGLDVKEMMSEQGCFIVHTVETATSGDMLYNTVTHLKPKVSAADRIRIALVLNPAISASSIVEGSKQVGYRKLGLLVNGGTVVDASPGDMATEAVSVTHRKRRSHKQSVEKQVASDDRIRSVIESSGDSARHNELIVDNPEFAGLVIVLREDEGLREQVDARETIKEISQDDDIPIFLLRGGNLQELSLLENGLGFKLKDKGHPTTSPAEAVVLPSYLLSLEREEEIIERIEEDNLINYGSSPV